MSGMYDPASASDVTLKPFPDAQAPKNGKTSDPVNYLKACEQKAREQAITIETIKLLRRDVIDCFRREGVNHYENCYDVSAKLYNELHAKDMGQLHPE